jgi:hypothetical protein
LENITSEGSARAGGPELPRFRSRSPVDPRALEIGCYSITSFVVLPFSSMALI